MGAVPDRTFKVASTELSRAGPQTQPAPPATTSAPALRTTSPHQHTVPGPAPGPPRRRSAAPDLLRDSAARLLAGRRAGRGDGRSAGPGARAGARAGSPRSTSPRTATGR